MNSVPAPRVRETAPSLREEARQLMASPGAFFHHSVDEMHGIARSRLDDLQLQAAALCFEEQVERIPMVAKLAGNQGIKRIEAVEDIVPLLFEHTMYKSYPVSFLGNRQFDKLTTWLNKMTSVDLSQVDARGCDSIDGWLDLLAETTELDAVTTSGSTGTMSFIARMKTDIERGFRSNRITEFQSFGRPVAPGSVDGLIHVIWPIYADGHLMSFRAGQYLKKIFAQGREDHFHALYPEKGSSDLMWLAAQLRAAAARGDASRVDVPPNLLARRAELEAQQANMGKHQMAFVESLAETLRDQRVYCMYPSYPLYQVAARGLAAGRSCHFSPDSSLGTAGGSKGMPLPEDWAEQVSRFFGIERLERYYGMSEITGLSKMCPAGRYHTQPWIIPFILDPDTSALQPRRGVQKGRGAFFDFTLRGHWGGIITGDELEIDFSGPCACGQTSTHMSPVVERFGAKRGGDDKITCAAAPQAHTDAVEFLTTFS